MIIPFRLLDSVTYVCMYACLPAFLHTSLLLTAWMSPSVHLSISSTFAIASDPLSLPGAFIPPETMMHSPPLSDSPIFEKFSDRGKFSQFYLFPRNFLIFIHRSF